MLLAGLYITLAMPVEASFGLGAGARQPKGSTGRRSRSLPEEVRIQGSLEGFVAAALSVVLPPFFYIVAYRHVILQRQHLWALLLLASAPLVLLTLLQVLCSAFHEHLPSKVAFAPADVILENGHPCMCPSVWTRMPDVACICGAL